MVVERLARRKAEEESRLTDGETGDCLSNRRAQGVEQKTFDRVVVQSAKCIWDVQPVVP